MLINYLGITRIPENKPLTTPYALSSSDTLKLLLTTQEGGSASRPHQAYLLLKDAASNLDVSYPLSMKASGKAKVELVRLLSYKLLRHADLLILIIASFFLKQSHKDLPVQFLESGKPIEADLVIGSFGSGKGYNKPAFQLSIERDPHESSPSSEALRYGKLDEIHHTFNQDPKSPPVVISMVFVGAVLATLPLLAGLVSCDTIHISVSEIKPHTVQCLLIGPCRESSGYTSV